MTRQHPVAIFLGVFTLALYAFQLMRAAQSVCFARNPFFKLSAFIFNKDAIINFTSVCFGVECCFFFPFVVWARGQKCVTGFFDFDLLARQVKAR